MLIPIKHLRTGLFVLLLPCGLVWSSDSTSVLTTQNKIKELDNQIVKLKQSLLTAQDKQGLLNRELTQTEKQINEGIKQLENIQHSLTVKQSDISHLQQRVSKLNQQLSTQKELLAKHVNIRYKIGEYQSLKWIINQDDPYSLSRLLTYHQYLVRSRLKLMDEIAATQKNLTLSQTSLKAEIQEQRTLQGALSNHQKKLLQDRHYHNAVIQTLDHEIKTKVNSLQEAQRNKINLSRLLKSLAMQSQVQHAKLPFSNMRHKLPRPVAVDKQATRAVRQGLTFFAGEGTPVRAVYPGKIVFSDWLNGYGLLLILDHGNGFMTLYAHNQSFIKQKGASVLQGEHIAAVGHSGGMQENGLYFEVRQRGKAVPPQDWLS